MKCSNCFYNPIWNRTRLSACTKRESVYFNEYIPGFGCSYFITTLQKERNDKLKRLKKLSK